MFSSCIFQALTEVATLVARALYAQAGGAVNKLSSINVDPHIVRLSDYLWSLFCIHKLTDDVVLLSCLVYYS